MPSKENIKMEISSAFFWIKFKINSFKGAYESIILLIIAL